ncbi:hypothetical protein BO83DRAFT_456211 [Aspergillus eucalypticola CBS 122712]|uniref:Uncharacterized protein n=1 Tax=Aspergillus eucalypticola (strain CBS 122712 / IBT 29274) TaxID=1448314 RepID=A0A317UNP5_ASPEC|nr:uncharacterized protein BO83DRAFT_456211 [Aspergillus eucalypticola CBS 122712]PWY63574.1 hypothetical protein BO83DRAFT_456211 [Aspergillus eucalypticola CBS 122712]
MLNADPGKKRREKEEEGEEGRRKTFERRGKREEEERKGREKEWGGGKGKDCAKRKSGVGVERSAPGRGHKPMGDSGDRWIATVRRSCPAAVLAIWATSGAATTGKWEAGKRGSLGGTDGGGKQANRPVPGFEHALGPIMPLSSFPDSQWMCPLPILTNGVPGLNGTWLGHVHLSFGDPYFEKRHKSSRK